MYSTVRRLNVLKRLGGDGIITPLTCTKPIAGCRDTSGLRKQVKEAEKETSKQPCFQKFLSYRMEEASRSAVMKVRRQKDLEALNKYCNSYGTVLQIFKYSIQTGTYVLVEMSRREELMDMLNDSRQGTGHYESSSPYQLQFTEFKRGNLELTGSSSADMSNVTTESVGLRNVRLMLSDLSEESLCNVLYEIHDSVKLNELGTRLRFLMCKQIESAVCGFIQDTVVLPFGSAVNGFGTNTCDLDLVVLQNSKLKPISIPHSSMTAGDMQEPDRTVAQKHLNIVCGVIKNFVTGSTLVNFIRHAKVPIVKYRHSFTGVDCDVSMYCQGGILMSQLLYSISILDNRIRPLTTAVKLWAEQVKLTTEAPGPNITNFALVTLVIFFLQQSARNFAAIVPKLNNLSRTNDLLFDDTHLVLLGDGQPRNENSLANLLLLFFKFYACFNFKDFGCCVRTGDIVPNVDACAMYIRYVVEPNLNISKNVSAKQRDKFQMYCQRACTLLEKDGNFENGRKILTDLFNASQYAGVNKSSAKSSKTEVKIGDVSKNVEPPKQPQYTPHGYMSMGRLSQNTLKHLRWMLQKDILKQDIFLIGRPGPTRRQLAMAFLEMTGREVEYVALSRDTTEADLKQRREIQGGTAKYLDQNAVRAATEGRVLVLEGIEKAERNVLPVLNNLLENREMHLEDGRFLIPASRYDKLLKDHSEAELEKWKLVRVSDDFRVIALGLPVPKYVGNPLDPPLRSRFQARNISHGSFQEQLAVLREMAPNGDIDKMSQILSCAFALLSEESVSLGLPDFPVDNVTKLGLLLQQFPSAKASDLLARLYPYNVFLNKEGREAVQHVLKTFHVDMASVNKGNSVTEVKCSSADGLASCSVSLNSANVLAKVPCGGAPGNEPASKYIPTTFQEFLVAELLQSHSVSDFCVIGPKGCGKSATVLRLANLLNYEVESIVLYQDITSRDLIQQRNTLPNGDTVWNNSPLVQAALDGKMAILDGIDRVHPSTLSVIHSLVHDRDIQLYDGKRLVRHDRYEEIKARHNLTDDDMSQSQIYKVHPSFRIVALAESSPNDVGALKWLSPEMLSLFLFHEMRPLSHDEESHIIEKLHGPINEKVRQILNLARSLRESTDPTLASLSSSFSTRQLLRMSKRLSSYPRDSVHDTVQKACLARFLPPITKDAFDVVLKKQGIQPAAVGKDVTTTCHVTDTTVKIGETEVTRYVTQSKSKVPDILFFDIPQHLELLEWLVQDFTLGEHLLLVGNQGVGKNKIADRLLQLLNRPREYIQLHRDTTVATLTLQPTVKEGIVSYEDSPLVQAVKMGHVLVVDEADKAPTHVTCILKTLVERGEMTLSDGRKIVPNGDFRRNNPNTVEVHPDFRMIVLANRPGFPFLGNDFFGALGDLFSCHVVDNPSPESEIALLKQYGPDVPENVILKLVKAFGELREMADKGLVQYPYSTREVVNVVKHLQNFSTEGITEVVSNVFDFDKYSTSALEAVVPVLQKHGIPINVSAKNVTLAREYPLPKLKHTGVWDISKGNSNSQQSVEISNLKVGPARSLKSSKTEVDITEARGSLFSEMHSYATLPMPTGNLAFGVAVSTDENSSRDTINVLAVNPLRLYITSLVSPQVKVLDLGSVLPRAAHGIRYKFNFVALTGKLTADTTLLVHEENLNLLFLVNTADESMRQLDLTSMSDKVKSLIRMTPVSRWKLNEQLAKDNLVILYAYGSGSVRVLDLNAMNVYSMDFQVPIKSLQVLSDDKWLLQCVENKKYLLTKKSPGDPIPSVFRHVAETAVSENGLGTLTGALDFDLDEDVLSKILGKKIESPNRILLSDECYASVSVGFPELECSSNDIYSWFRDGNAAQWSGARGKSVLLENSLQIVTPVSKMLAPRESQKQSTSTLGFLEVLDLRRQTLQYIPVPEGSEPTWYTDTTNLGIFVSKLKDERLVTVDHKGNIRLWETGYLQLKRSLDDWQKLVGKGEDSLRLTIKRDSGLDVSEPKHGKVDPENKPHVGGNTWAGGTGGRDTAGLGGKGGPYRLDAGHDVHQISDAEKESVPEEVKRAAREMGQRAFQQRLKEIRMSEYDHEVYQSYLKPVAEQVKMLKVVIESVQAKAQERDWVRHQTSGDLDDLKLIEGLTGEKTIYRRRMKREPDPGAPQTKPKRLKLVADVSGSMYRFNSYDGRLNRMLEATVLVMEAFENQESKFKYDITGHSGDGYNIVFVDPGNPPKNNKDRLEVIKTMSAHAQFCMSGDHTLPATMDAIESLSKEDCDEAIVVVLSDANLERYGIRPSSFGRILTSNPDVNAYAILIGSLGDQAERLAATLPAGRAFVCMDLRNIPQIMRQIFTTSVLSSA